MLQFTRLTELRAQRPLLHCISNLVSANDCANLLLAVGASPIMAQAPEEMEELTHQSTATVLNLGTPDTEKFRSCLLCAQSAQALHQPVVLDPVGIGASSWRLAQAERLLQVCKPTILRANPGEALALLHRKGQEQGVDSPLTMTTEERLSCARQLAQKFETVVLLTGPEDTISDGQRYAVLTGGSSQMPLVTGSGCMLSVLCGAFAAVESDAYAASLLASAFWKVCSLRAEKAAQGRGTASFRIALLDAASVLHAPDFSADAQALWPALCSPECGAL